MEYGGTGGSSWDCAWAIQHGNYGTAGYTTPEYVSAYGTSTPCTSVSGQVVAGGPYTVGNIVYDDIYMAGGQHTSVKGAGYYLFGSNYWVARPGAYNVYYYSNALGC